MAQMKAYAILIKNWTQICLNIVLCSHEQIQSDVHQSIVFDGIVSPWHLEFESLGRSRL